jgi:hypothetical protein
MTDADALYEYRWGLARETLEDAKKIEAYTPLTTVVHSGLISLAIRESLKVV